MEKKPDKGLNIREIEKIRKFGYYFALGMVLLTAVGFWKGFVLWFIVITALLALYHFIFALINYIPLIPTYNIVNFIGKATWEYSHSNNIFNSILCPFHSNIPFIKSIGQGRYQSKLKKSSMERHTAYRQRS